MSCVILLRLISVRLPLSLMTFIAWWLWMLTLNGRSIARYIIPFSPRPGSVNGSLQLRCHDSLYDNSTQDNSHCWRDLFLSHSDLRLSYFPGWTVVRGGIQWIDSNCFLSMATFQIPHSSFSASLPADPSVQLLYNALSERPEEWAGFWDSVVIWPSYDINSFEKW